MALLHLFQNCFAGMGEGKLWTRADVQHIAVVVSAKKHQHRFVGREMATPDPKAVEVERYYTVERSVKPLLG